ncbi:alkaline phosphatase family protein [Modestobacter sp. I12A-02628]|uniref:Alkaline phosphatase family protein n=1 Tax=Goekera deserti TaxID=2497753 RepID=A0A7K3WGZ8_9ACTN|nr:alkaline phosphatase D family protein [Goekera deserti]MPQ97282.1 alkaline phosphatase family protein [Goekera deserti]NDI50207.1 alkaline phosphatase family protein [Goekera deserti]NEL55775.1 alkaline phosphatase family protein [Goekera deserti]
MPQSAGIRPLLLLGPLLRHVDPVSATIWVEVDRPCEVEVLGRRVRSFGVAGHHYALVVIEDLEPGTSTPYEVLLDGDVVWPQRHSAFPPSRIRTTGREGAFRLAFGSCRYATPSSADIRDGIPPDALNAYARQMAETPEDTWPDALVLLGDQVYADEITPATRSWMATRRDLSQPPGEQAADFEEYSRLYAESWGDPEVRWLLSTLPSSMIFDDHEMIDDWNTSAAWRAQVTPETWWDERISGGLVSYWVYQHLGNLSPAELADSPVWQKMQGQADAEPMLREMAISADGDPEAIRWSYVRHWGPARLVMVDSRAGRVLDEQRRQILDDREFDWVESELSGAVRDGVEHLLIGTSLPWLLPHAVHDIERWNETLNKRHHGRPLGRLAEKLRQAADLEHWAAFGHSFERMGAALVSLARGERGRAPATALLLSGDVHHAYAAELVRPGGLSTRVHQLTVSPLHNQAPHAIEIGFRIGWSRWARAITRGIGRLARVPGTELAWEKQAGPFFGNEIGELVLQGRDARFLLFAGARAEDDGGHLRKVLDMPLS